MKRPLATLALAAIPALVLTACNGGSGSGASAPLPNAPTNAQHTRLHHLDNGPQDLHAGGADFVGYAYNLMEQPVGYYNQYQAPPGPGSLFYAAPTTGTIYYCIANSTDGRKAFEDNGDSGFPPTGACAPLGSTITGFGGRQDPLDFVGTATALPSTECCSGSSPYYQHRDVGSETWGQPFEFPQIGGLIAFPYRPGDFDTYVKEIKLSTWSYCAISNGTISNWNDPAVTADNGKSVTGGTNETITYFFRSDSAATSYLLTNKLNSVCNQSWSAPYNKAPYESGSRSAAWSFGVNSTWPGPGSSGDPNPNFIGEEGSPGILAAIQTTPFSTGYMEGSYAKAADPHVGQALLQNGYDKSKKTAIFVNPTDHTALVKALAGVVGSSIDYGMGSDGNSLGSSTPWCQLYVPYTAFVNPPVKTYPIVAVSYLLFYGQNNGVHLSDKQKLINFVESSAATKIEAKFEYTALSKSVESAVISALNGNSSQAACLQ
jgi:ABC-type phosphate transport system substrate-binding protein